jgi:hypothetical protein
MTKGTNIIIGSSIVDNYTILDNYSYYVMTSPSGISATINGFTGGTDGRLLIIINATGQSQTFFNEGASSSSSNRFSLNSASKVISNNNSISFIYVSGLTIGGAQGQSRWVQISL